MVGVAGLLTYPNGRVSGLSGGRGRLQGGPPAQPDPLLDIEGQRGPERLGSRFQKTPHMELPQADLGLDPGVGEFRQGAASAVDTSRLLGPHLLPEGGDARIID